MPPRPPLAASLLLLLLAPLAGFSKDLPADTDAGKALLREGDKLADRGDTTGAVLCYKRGFEQLLPGMRKLPFKQEVKRDVTEREKLRDVLIKEIDEEMPPKEFRANELGMKALGLLPRDHNLKETMIKVYAEEIAAFYDTKTKTMHLIKEPEAKLRKPPSFLERLMGKKPGFDKDENKTVIAHELTHALADQNFDIDSLQKTIKHDDDRELALSALIEGEATLTMIGAQQEDWDGEAVRRIPSATLDRTFGLMGALMPLGGSAALREAPPILSESMLFPYVRGLVFCSRLTNDGGWKALDDAYRNPPLSTEQVLHPEKYRARPDRPTTVDLGCLDAGAGWTELGRNVVGELQLSVLLRRYGGKKAAAGWDGDQYAVFEGPAGRLGLVWLTTWDGDDDAREFALGYGRLQGEKAAADLPAGSPDSETTASPAERPQFALERRGVDVAVVEGFPPGATERLLGAAFNAKKAEMVRTERPERARDAERGGSSPR